VKNLVFLPALFVIAIAQATVLNHFKFFGVKPDLFIGFVAAASIYLNWKWALPFSLLAGLLKDLFGTAGFGINVFLLPLWSYLILQLAGKISLDDPVAVSAAAFFTALLNDIASRLFYLYYGKYISLGIFLRIMLIEPAYTALAVLFFIRIFACAAANLRRKENANVEAPV